MGNKKSLNVAILHLFKFCVTMTENTMQVLCKRDAAQTYNN